jgi:hypothetical protein
MVVNFGDSSHEYADDYDKQIREFLDKSQPAGIEVRGGQLGLNSVSVPIDGFPSQSLHRLPLRGVA